MKVFISSTMTDLIAERASVATALEQFNVFDVLRAEMFSAQADASRIKCITAAATADLVILILGGRYGFIPEIENPDALSVTHLEYRAARADGVPVLAFCQHGTKRNEQAQRFVDEVEHFTTGVFRLEWDTVQQLTDGVLRSVRDWLVSRARAALSPPSPDQELVALLRSRLPIACRISAAGPAPSEAVEQWLGEVLRRTQQVAAAQRLPAVTDGRAATAGECRALRIVYSEGATRHLWHLHLHLHSALGAVKVHPPVDLSMSLTELNATQITQVVYLLVLLESGALRTAIAEGSAFAGVTADHKLTQGLFMNLAVATGTTNISLVPELARAALSVELETEATIVVVTTLMAYMESLNQRHANVAARIAQGWAIQLLTRAFKHSPDDADTLYTMSRELAYLTGDVAIFGDLIGAHPDYDARWYVHRDVGQVLFRQRRFAAAADEYEHAARLRQTDAQLFRWAGDAAYYDGNRTRPRRVARSRGGPRVPSPTVLDHRRPPRPAASPTCAHAPRAHIAAADSPDARAPA